MKRFIVLFHFSVITAAVTNAQGPVIASFTPTEGIVGTPITINGSGFDATPANNVVSFGAINADVVSSSVTQITVRVPVGAASITPIVVTNLASQRIFSSVVLHPSVFTVKYPGGKINGNTYTQSQWPVGNGPFSIVSGDFNNDGKADVATANFNSNTVSVLTRNSANTGFNAKVDFAVAAAPRNIIAADFNADGKMDLATASNTTTKTFSVLIRNSNSLESGGFTLSNNPTAYQLSALTSGDMNGDGRADIVSANYNTNTVSVYLRNAANTGFTLSGNYVTGSTVTNVEVGDFNADGKLDIAALNWVSNNVSVLLRNAANNGFSSALNYAVGTGPRGIAVGDFNADGKSDLVVTNHSSFTISVLLWNVANTGFNSAVHYPMSIMPQWVVVGDFNGDGKSDLAINGFQQNSPTDPNVFILINNGNGTFGTPIGYFVNAFIRSMTTGDYNGDGMADLAPVHNQANDVFLLESNLAMWKGVTSEWDQAQNWWGGKIPSAASETVVSNCINCPMVNNAKQLRRLWMEDSTVELNGNTIEVTEDASVQQTQLMGGGTLVASDFLEFTNNVAHEKLILRKTGGDNNFWKGSNRYKGELQIINTSSKTITPSAQTSDLIQN